MLLLILPKNNFHR